MAALPARPTVSALVKLAIGRRNEIIEELTEANAPLIVTVGEEARRVVAATLDAQGAVTSPLSTEPYGQRCGASVKGQDVEWIALVHPGQRAPRWRAVHDAWRSKQQPSA